VVIDAALKGEHATRMMRVALDLASVAGDDRQARLLARYVLLHADTAVRWTRLWEQELRRSVEGRRRADGAKTPLRRLRQEYANQKNARDKLTARRQAVANRRAQDLRSTVALLQRMTHSRMTVLCQRAEAACAALGSMSPPATPLASTVLNDAHEAMAAAALDPSKVYTDASSYAAGEPNLLPITPTGPLGRIKMQVNDLQDHLELLNALRSLAHRRDDVGLLLRAALIVEASTLLDLTIGPPPGKPSGHSAALIFALDRGRGEGGHNLLVQLTNEVIPAETRINVRDLRNRVGAHLDTRMTFADIRDTLLEVSVDDLLGLVDMTLEWLDAAACSHVDLGLLVLGHRELAGLKPAALPTLPAPFQPAEHADLLDSPFGAIVGGGFGDHQNARVAGMIAGRAKNRRQRWRPRPPASPLLEERSPSR